jgi:20S proteasome alpha/beta subunit
MECLLGITFRDFVLIAADMTNARSIMVVKDGKSLIFIVCELVFAFFNAAVVTEFFIL